MCHKNYVYAVCVWGVFGFQWATFIRITGTPLWTTAFNTLTQYIHALRCSCILENVDRRKKSSLKGFSKKTEPDKAHSALGCWSEVIWVCSASLLLGLGFESAQADFRSGLLGTLWWDQVFPPSALSRSTAGSWIMRLRHLHSQPNTLTQRIQI